jgi:DNA repair exonuclease SbcCD ATPase subunit
MTEQKPSAEMQAVVMNLWNAIRETAQSTSAVHAERRSMQKRIDALEKSVQQETQDNAKLQAYTEHLQSELKQLQNDYDVLQQQHHDSQEISRRREETVQELRRVVIEQEEIVSHRTQEVGTQAAFIESHRERFAEQQQEIADLRAELSSSNDRAMLSAADLGNLQPRYSIIEAERDTLTETVSELRWRMNALEEQTTAEHDEYEHKLNEIRVYSGELLAKYEALQTHANEEQKRLNVETAERISVLLAEREAMRDTMRDQSAKAEQETTTWQQIAEEQSQTLRTQEEAFAALKTEAKIELAAALRANEEEITAKNNELIAKTTELEALTQAATAHLATAELLRNELNQASELNAWSETEMKDLEHRLEQERDAHRHAILARERLHGDLELRNQMLEATEARFGEYEAQIHTLQMQNTALTNERAGQSNLHLSDEERTNLSANIQQLLVRVEAALVE